MVVELLVALVESVHSREEGQRVRHVNAHWHFQGARNLPHRIEPRIVNLDQVPGLSVLTKIQAQGLENLDPTRAPLACTLNLARLEIRVSWLGGSGPPWLGEHPKTAGMGGVQYTQGFLQPLAVAAC